MTGLTQHRRAVLAAAAMVAVCPPAGAAVITGTASYAVSGSVSLGNQNVISFNDVSAVPRPLQSVTDGPRSAFAAAIAPSPLDFAVTGGYTASAAATAGGFGQITYDFQTGSDAPLGANIVLSTSGLASLSLVNGAPNLPSSQGGSVYATASSLVRLLNVTAGTQLFQRSANATTRLPDPLSDDWSQSYSFIAAPGQAYRLLLDGEATVGTSSFFVEAGRGSAFATILAAAILPDPPPDTGPPPMTNVPEPAPVAVLGAALLALLGMTRSSRRRAGQR